jgi:hypothetical protein
MNRSEVSFNTRVHDLVHSDSWKDLTLMVTYALFIFAIACVFFGPVWGWVPLMVLGLANGYYAWSNSHTG